MNILDACKELQSAIDSERRGDGMTSNQKALAAAQTIVDFCHQQKSCQNCLFGNQDHDIFGALPADGKNNGAKERSKP